MKTDAGPDTAPSLPKRLVITPDEVKSFLVDWPDDAWLVISQSPDGVRSWIALPNPEAVMIFVSGSDVWPPIPGFNTAVSAQHEISVLTEFLSLPNTEAIALDMLSRHREGALHDSGGEDYDTDDDEIDW